MSKHFNACISEWSNAKMITWFLRIKMCDSSIKIEGFSKANSQLASFFHEQNKAMPIDPKKFLDTEGWLCPCGLTIQLKTDQFRISSRLTVPGKCGQSVPPNECISRGTSFKASVGNSHSLYFAENRADSLQLSCNLSSSIIETHLLTSKKRNKKWETRSQIWKLFLSIILETWRGAGRRDEIDCLKNKILNQVADMLLLL